MLAKNKKSMKLSVIAKCLSFNERIHKSQYYLIC